MIAFVNVVQQMLEDVQERLVYKAQAMLDNDVRGFIPTPSDLNYPDRLAVPVCNAHICWINDHACAG